MEGLLQQGSQEPGNVPENAQAEQQAAPQAEQQAAQPLNERIEPSIREQMDDNQNSDMDKVINAGMKLLFGKETHKKLFEAIRPEDDIPIEDELGTAAVNIMMIMFQKSGNSIPGEVMIPAGTILLARAVDYINESGIAQVTDEQFGLALEMFVDVLQSKFSPEGQSQGEQPQDGEQPQQEQPQQPEQPIIGAGEQQGGL